MRERGTDEGEKKSHCIKESREQAGVEGQSVQTRELGEKKARARGRSGKNFPLFRSLMTEALESE